MAENRTISPPLQFGQAKDKKNVINSSVGTRLFLEKGGQTWKI
jgi:hypothetical protein